MLFNESAPRSAPLAVCLLGKIHWFFYLVVLLMIDVLLCVVNALLGVVVLRSLPWDQRLSLNVISLLSLFEDHGLLQHRLHVAHSSGASG